MDLHCDKMIDYCVNLRVDVSPTCGPIRFCSSYDLIESGLLHWSTIPFESNVTVNSVSLRIQRLPFQPITKL